MPPLDTVCAPQWALFLFRVRPLRDRYSINSTHPVGWQRTIMIRPTTGKASEEARFTLRTILSFARLQPGGLASAKPVSWRRRGRGGFLDATGPAAAPHGTDSGRLPGRRAGGGAPVVFFARVRSRHLLCISKVLFDVLRVCF